MSTPELRPVVTLVGGYRCELTAEEQNEWHEYINDACIYREYIVAQNLEAAAVVANVCSGDMGQLVSSRLIAEAALYRAALSWHTELLADELDEQLEAVRAAEEANKEAAE